LAWQIHPPVEVPEEVSAHVEGVEAEEGAVAAGVGGERKERRSGCL